MCFAKKSLYLSVYKYVLKFIIYRSNLKQTYNINGQCDADLAQTVLQSCDPGLSHERKKPCNAKVIFVMRYSNLPVSNDNGPEHLKVVDGSIQLCPKVHPLEVIGNYLQKGNLKEQSHKVYFITCLFTKINPLWPQIIASQPQAVSHMVSTL